jgi:hypothetical protein
MSGVAAGGKLDKVQVSTLYGDYKVIDGISFPTKITIKSMMGDTEGELTDIKVNEPIAAKLYTAE